MLQTFALGTRLRVVMTTLVAGLSGAGVFGLAMLVHGPSVFGFVAGIGGALIASIIVGMLMRRWALGPVASIARERGPRLGEPRRPESATAEELVKDLVKQLDD